MERKVSDESTLGAVLQVVKVRSLRSVALKCFKSIMYHFFGLQYKAALFPHGFGGRHGIPVSRVDHPLDMKIPFSPGYVYIYLDFVSFRVRILGFLLRRYGGRAHRPVGEFLKSMGELYAFAAEVYQRNLSTTNRPRYLKRLRFVVIHAFDPHLMCVPSLHVMVVIRAYTKFRDIARSLGEETALSSQIEELRRGAVAITEAILYIKQHSVNCVAAALYASTRFDPALFPETEAADFVSRLFLDQDVPGKADQRLIRDYIMGLYRQFLSEGLSDSQSHWTKPLIKFLNSCPSL